jgi:hypothetical protein
MEDFNFFWSKGNEKLNKTARLWEKRFDSHARFASFNIPRLMSENGQTTCPYAGVCKEYCYADQGRFAMQTSQRTREHNLNLINRMSWDSICEGLVEDLHRQRSLTHIRIHDSGDFFSRGYYQTWIRVAQQLPDLLFYAYTKSIPLIDWDAHPENFRVTQSVGGKRDHDIDLSRPHAQVFVDEEDRKRAGYCDGNASDMPAILGQTRIGLVYHGTRLLDEDSRRHLEVVA